MKQYLLSLMQPDGDPPPEVELNRIMHDIAVIEDEMRTAGAWVFSGALHEPSTATVLRPKDGEVLLTDGPYTEGKEHLGGFTILRADDLDAALVWARRLTSAIGLPIEVRPFQ